MKKILIPTDLSSHSINGIRIADQIAKKHNGSLTVLYVVDHPFIYSSHVKTMESMDQVGNQIMKLATEKVTSTINGIGLDQPVEIKIEKGPILTTILGYEKDKDFDLMVVGSKKMNGIGAYLFGTLTDKIIHKSTLPVLVVRDYIDFSQIDNILVGSSFKLKDKELKENIEFVRKLRNGSIELVRINTPTDFMSQDVFDERVRNLRSLSFLHNCEFTNINFKNPSDGLIYRAVTTKSDMIVIGDKKRSTFRRWVLGEDIAEKVMDFSNLPVLIL